MGVLKRNRWLTPLGLALAVVVLLGARAGALVGNEGATASDRAGTLVVFPKVIADGTRDTLITLSNVMNTERYAHCVYVNGAGACSISGALCVPGPGAGFGCPDGQICEARCIETNFDIALTAQQPTVWRVSTGRVVNPADGSDGACDVLTVEDTLREGCPGIDPGNVIPPNQPFRGELKCYETDTLGGAPGAPPSAMAGNAFKGEAMIETLESGEISKYNSINFEANSDVLNSDQVLELNNSEVNVCPARLEFTHYAHLAQDSIAASLAPEACNSGTGLCSGGANPGAVCTLPGGTECLGGACVGCAVRSEITFVPCTEHLESQVVIPTTVQIRAIDQLELSQSASFTLGCWANLSLDQLSPSIFNAFNRGEFLKTRIFTNATGLRCLDGSVFSDPNADPSLVCNTDADCGAGGVCGPQPGVLAIMEEFYEGFASETTLDDGAAAVDPHMIGQRTGLCRADLAVSCRSDADCTGGLCRGDATACTTNSQCAPTQSVPNNRCDICLIDEITIPEVVPNVP